MINPMHFHIRNEHYEFIAPTESELNDAMVLGESESICEVL